jgi:predicted secreted Zn-dependent protease
MVQPQPAFEKEIGVMINVLAFAAAAVVQAAPATAPYTLQTLPGTKVHYYDVSGATSTAIQSSLDRMIKSQPKTAGELYTWTSSINVGQDTMAGVCRIASAKAALDANVYLPRLAQESQVSSTDLERWKAYETDLEQTAFDNLKFVADRLPAIEQSLVGKPCDQAATIWNSSIQTLMQQQQAYDRKHKRPAKDSTNPFTSPGTSRMGSPY